MGRNKKVVDTYEENELTPKHDFDTLQDLCMIFRQGSEFPMSVNGVVYRYIKGKGWVRADELGNDQTDSVTEGISTNE
jgi:hypothetical protein